MASETENKIHVFVVQVINQKSIDAISKGQNFDIDRLLIHCASPKKYKIIQMSAPGLYAIKCKCFNGT